MPLNQEMNQELPMGDVPQVEGDEPETGEDTTIQNAAAPQTFQDREKDIHPSLVDLSVELRQRDKEKLEEIGRMCFEEYEEDEESRSNWLEMQALWRRLYFQSDEPVNPPWTGSSSESIPILVEGCKQFHARAFRAFFGSRDFVAGIPVGRAQPEDLDRAERVANYMNFQLGVQDTSYKRNKDRLLHLLPLEGSYFTKTYRDSVKKRNVVENVRAIDLAVSYHAVGKTIEELERKTQIIWMPMRQAKFLKSQKFFSVLPAPFDESSNTDAEKVQAAVDEATGVNKPESSVSPKPAKVLEQHRYLDLDGDDIEEPYIVWICAQTQQVLRVAIRYETDEQGNPTNNKEPVEVFTHYVYDENPDGFYGLGLGHTSGDVNKAVNKLLRQSIDAATLQSMPAGFYHKGAGISKGVTEVIPGKFQAIDGNEDINKSICWIQHPGPSSAQIALMDKLIDRADRLNGVTDMLSGAPEKVNQPTTTSQLIEQGLTQFSAVQARVHVSLEQELSKLYKLNGLYLNQEEYFIIEDANRVKESMVSKDDFSNDLQVRPSFDPNNSTEQVKIQRAKMEYDTIVANPIMIQNPNKMMASLRRFLKAIGSKNIDEVIPTDEEIAQQQQAQAQAQEQQQQSEMQLKQAELQIDQGHVQNESQMNQIKATEVQGNLQNKQLNTQIKAQTNERKLAIQEQTAMVDTVVKISDAKNNRMKGNDGQ